MEVSCELRGEELHTSTEGDSEDAHTELSQPPAGVGEDGASEGFLGGDLERETLSVLQPRDVPKALLVLVPLEAVDWYQMPRRHRARECHQVCRARVTGRV